MNAKSILHGSFRAGIAMKGVDGALEAIGGVLLWFVKTSAMGKTLHTLFEHELSRDPHDFIAMHLLHASEKLAHSDPLFASIYLLSHGIIKAALAAALWMNELWAYPLAIFVFSTFSVYQVYRYTHTHSVALLLLTVFDVAIVYLTWQEYRMQKAERNARGSG